MVKPKLTENTDGIKLFFAILKLRQEKDEVKLSDIINHLGLNAVAPRRIISENKNFTSIIKSKRKPKEKVRVISTNAVTEKLTTLCEKRLIKRLNKNKGAKYEIEYDGIIDYLIKRVFDEKNYTTKRIGLYLGVVDFFSNKQKIKDFLIAYFDYLQKHKESNEYSLNEIFEAFLSGYMYYIVETKNLSFNEIELYHIGYAFMSNKGLSPLKGITSISHEFWKITLNPIYKSEVEEFNRWCDSPQKIKEREEFSKKNKTFNS